MLRYDRQTKPGLVALYDIRPENGAGSFLQPRSLHGASSSIIITVTDRPGQVVSTHTCVQPILIGSFSFLSCQMLFNLTNAKIVSAILVRTSLQQFSLFVRMLQGNKTLLLVPPVHHSSSAAHFHCLNCQLPSTLFSQHL